MKTTQMIASSPVDTKSESIDEEQAVFADELSRQFRADVLNMARRSDHERI